MDFTISDEVKSVQQLAAQIMGDFTEVDKLKAIEQQDDVFDEKLWASLCFLEGRAISSYRPPNQSTLG